MTATENDTSFAHRHRILVVDDEEGVLQMMRRFLSSAGYECHAAHNATEALNLTQQVNPCMIIIDIMMPGTDGYETCRALRRLPGLERKPIALMSGKLEGLDPSTVLGCGADDFLHKPFDKTDLLLRVAVHMRLLDRETQLRAVTEAAQDAIIVIDDRGDVVQWNPAAERILGYTRAEVLGKNVHQLVAPERFHEAHRKAFEVFARHGTGSAVGKTLELPARHKRGHEVTCELSLSAVRLSDRWHAIGIVRDVTDKKRVEVELGHARKLEAVGRLAAGIAHEINTPTQFVSDSVQFIKGAFEDGLRLIRALQKELQPLRAQDAALDARLKEAEAASDLEFVLDEGPKAFARTEEGLNRISTIVRAMKEFSHPATKEKAPADLNRAIQTTLTIARNEYKYVAEAETDLGELPPVPCLLGELNQVLLNLIVNAAHAIGDKVKGTEQKGKITIRTRRENGHAVIAISDTGCGIPEEIRGKIFEPFFTTKEVGKGTGQGLAIARSVVVDKHGGRLDFESRVGEGTTFFIRLPLGPADGK